MSTQIRRLDELNEPIIRRKALSARNEGSMMTVIDAGEYGLLVTDEPEAHGGSGEGPSPLQTVVGALCGCEAVTFNRTAAELGFAYRGIEFEAEYTIDIRGRMGHPEVR
ncbi:MAG: OsmC family protein, partial [Acidobacteriota bacterium]|nr:OsmC family protein [Acidobacteriota bacterium]